MPRSVLLARARPSWIAASKLVGEAAVIFDTLATAIVASLVGWLPAGSQQANMQPGKPVANEPSRLLCLCFRNDSLAAYIAFSRWRDLRQVGGTTEKPVPAGSTISTVQMDRPRYWTRRGSPKRDVQFVHRRRVAFAAAKRSALSTLPITCIAS